MMDYFSLGAAIFVVVFIIANVCSSVTYIRSYDTLHAVSTILVFVMASIGVIVGVSTLFLMAFGVVE